MRRLTSWWAADARLQKALVTSSDLRAPEDSFDTSSLAVRLVMSSSALVNHPDVSGQVVTSSWEAGGSRLCGMRHSGGIEANSSLRFLAPSSSTTT